MRKTSFDIPDQMYAHLRVASAAVKLSPSEYIRASIQAALEVHAENEPMIAKVFAYLDERERSEPDGSPESVAA